MVVLNSDHANSSFHTICKESILSSQVDETNAFMGVVDEFKADGHSDDEATKRAIQLIEDERGAIVTSSGEIHLKRKNGGITRHPVATNESLDNDHYINHFVKKQLQEIAVTSNNYQSFLLELDEVYFSFTVNSTESKYKIEIDTL